MTAEQRAQTKAITYGILYGMGARSLGEQMQLPIGEAAALVQSFKASFSGDPLRTHIIVHTHMRAHTPTSIHACAHMRAHTHMHECKYTHVHTHGMMA